MIRRSIALLATIAFMSVPCLAEPDAVGPSHSTGMRRHRSFPRPLFRPPVFRPRRPPPNLIAPPGQFVPPRIGHPSPLERDQIPIETPFSHGFNLTVPMDGMVHGPIKATLDRYAEVGPALGTCWTPPAGLSWKAITIRLSFKRDGSVNGEPRIPFTDAGSAERNTDLAHSLLAGLKQCTPLPFSPSLGAAIAGEIFAIRFTQQDSK